jgi:hypothetical protein
MCEIGKKLKLCTCLINGNLDTVVHNKNSRRHKKNAKSDSGRIYLWILKKVVGPSELVMDGMVIKPDDALEKNLTADNLLDELNQRNCFDFEFTPDEGDNLEIYEDNKSHRRFISFLYIKGMWTIGDYNDFVYKTEKINFGNVKFE